MLDFNFLIVKKIVLVVILSMFSNMRSDHVIYLPSSLSTLNEPPKIVERLRRGSWRFQILAVPKRVWCTCPLASGQTPRQARRKHPQRPGCPQWWRTWCGKSLGWPPWSSCDLADGIRSCSHSQGWARRRWPSEFALIGQKDFSSCGDQWATNSSLGFQSPKR